MELRALAVWLLLMVTAVANGLLREKFLTPHFGPQWAHVISTLILCAAILAETFATIAWIAPTSIQAAFTVGVFWMVLVLGFEFGFGHFVARKSWGDLLADYNLMRGRIWLLVPLVTFLAPVLASCRRRPI
ncbi:MAG: hypothetical protein ABI639_03805 [Thermoanaerobaculia bacterium]